MKLFYFLLTGIVAINSATYRPREFQYNYKYIFNSSYQKAIRLVAENKNDILEELRKFQANEKLLLAVVFPEILRYKQLQDTLETLALKIFFINFGKKYANFSIGLFQMKPSFAGLLEKSMTNQLSAHLLRQISLPKPLNSPRDQRQSLIERLSDFQWQVKYLAMFYHITKNKFSKQLSKMNLKQKVKFFACAYNVGLQKTFPEIMRWQRIAYFPYGKNANLGQQQFIYSDISWYFYSKYFDVTK